MNVPIGFTSISARARAVRLSVASLAFLLAVGQAPAFANIINVNGTTCTLVDAVEAANTDTAVGGCSAGSGPDTIVLAPASVHTLTVHTPSIVCCTGLDIRSDVTIEGNGSTIQRDPDAPPSAVGFRLLTVSNSNSLTLRDVTVRRGEAFSGGGVLNFSASLTIENSTLTENTAVYGGAVLTLSGATTTIRSTTVVANGIAFTGNTTPTPAVLNLDGTLVVEGSTLSGNDGGGVGAFPNLGDTATSTLIKNCTVFGNSARHAPPGGPGGEVGGGVFNAGEMTIEDTTVSFNSSAAWGAGIYNAGALTLRRTLVSGNFAGDDSSELYNHILDPDAAIAADNHNLFGHDGNPGVVNFAPGPSDIVPDAPLDAIISLDLADNGGATLTLALPSGSPALDVVPSDCAATDQRGVSRPQGAGCDIGAVELEATLAFPFEGFLTPVDNAPTLNGLKAGGAVPVKFRLGGDQGMDVVSTGSPTSQPINCDVSAALDPVSQTVTAGGNSLSYDPVTQTYTYVWKTDKTWAGTCREFRLDLIDGTQHTALFKFSR